MYNYVYASLQDMGFIIRPVKNYACLEASDFVAGEVAALRMRV